MNWNEYLMGFARHAAKKSKDSTKVGAVLVGPDNTVLLTAYNGPPRGVEDKPSRRDFRPAKYLFASHAEANLIAFAARQGIRTDGCTVYVTHQPCAACTRTLIQAGVKRVFHAGGITHIVAEDGAASRVMLEEAGVVLTRFVEGR